MSRQHSPILHNNESADGNHETGARTNETHASEIGLPRYFDPFVAGLGPADGPGQVRNASPPSDDNGSGHSLGPSNPLRQTEQTLFSRQFDLDAAKVRIHDNAQASASAHAIGARAFTVGTDVAFVAGAYRPDTVDGHLLLAHEVAHVAQQRGAESQLRPRLALDAVAERDADRAALTGTSPVIRLGQQAIQRYPEMASPSGLIDSFTSWGDLNEAGLGRRLFDLAWMSADHYGFVIRVINALSDTDRDDVASAFVRSARDDNLDEFATSATGRNMLQRLKRELLGGFTALHEGGEAIRLHHAIRRAEGAIQGQQRAASVMDEAADRGRADHLDITIPEDLSPAEIDDRLRLLSLLLTRLRTEHADDDAVIDALDTVEMRIDAERPQLTSLVVEPQWAARRVTIALEVAERGVRNLGNLGVMLQNYRDMSRLGAASPGYAALAERVRDAFVDSLAAAMDDDALQKLSVAEAQGEALPRALTEVDLGILAHRHAGYELTEGYAQEMVEWVEWIRDRLDPLEAEGREIAAARERGDPDVDERQAAFTERGLIIQYSIAAVSDWERALRAWEALASGGNVILGAYEDANAIFHRCQAMRDAAYAGNVEDLQARLERHQGDPAVAQFYRAIPMFIGASGMLIGLGIMLTAAMLSAGAGALVAGPEAVGAAAAGSVAIEALTFTAVSRGLAGAISPPPRTPFLLDLALNIGLFSLLRMTGMGIRSALAARGLNSITGIATHSASYGILSAWGVVHFRIEEGRWPSSDEIARMSVENLVMLAGIAVASGSVTRAIRSHQQLRALETFHSRYGTRLAAIEISRNQLRNRFRTELSAGRGDDAAISAELRAEADAIDARLRAIVEEVQSDRTIGIAELRTALADSAIDTAAVSGELLARSLGLAERVGLRRAGGVNLYTYEAGATEPLARRLTELGATVSETVDNSGRRTVTAEFEGEAPMLLVERAESAELTARLAEIAQMIETSGSSREQRQDVIRTLRTPHDAERGELEGFVLDTVLAENQRAFAELVEQLRTENPGAIVGMERGGAFLADVVGAGDAALARRVHHMQVHLTPEGRKFDGPAMQAEFQALIDAGAQRIAIIDAYMGGTTASALRDQVLLPLARDNPGVEFDVHWLRESLGFEAGGTMGPLRGRPNPRSPGGSQIRVEQRQMRLVLGDDMEIVFTPESREPITIFDRNGQIVRAEYPGPGETTRDVLIRMLRPTTAPAASD